MTTVAAAPAIANFWLTHTDLWFAVAEAKFHLAVSKTTKEETKFYQVLT
jgi:hypothetical protein